MPDCLTLRENRAILKLNFSYFPKKSIVHICPLWGSRGRVGDYIVHYIVVQGADYTVVQDADYTVVQDVFPRRGHQAKIF